MSTETPTFDAYCRLPKVLRTGEPGGEPWAYLNFPDMQTAADFITQGLVKSKFPGNPMTVEYLNKVHESPTGESNQYDAFVNRPDEETGEVRMSIRRYGTHSLRAYAELSDFIVETSERMAEATAIQEVH